MRKIKLHGREARYALVDDADFGWLSAFRWHANNYGYARKNPYGVYRSGTGEPTLLHRIILNAQKGSQVDHINGDKLDNRRQNLRLATNQQNTMNQRVRRLKYKSSTYKGVTWLKRDGKWLARIMFNYQQIRLGLFQTQEEAALAYDKAAKEYFGDFARPNAISARLGLK